MSSKKRKAPALSFSLGGGGGGAGPSKRRRVAAVATPLFAEDDEDEAAAAEGVPEHLVRPRIKQQNPSNVKRTAPHYATASDRDGLASAEMRHRLGEEQCDRMDKVAKFVVENGDAYESMLREREAADPRFRFLVDAGSPEAQYYRKRKLEVQVERDGEAAERARRSVHAHGGPSAPGAASAGPGEGADAGPGVGGAGPSPADTAAPAAAPSSSSLSAMEQFYNRAAAENRGPDVPYEEIEKPPPPNRRRTKRVAKQTHHLTDFLDEEEQEEFTRKLQSAVGGEAAQAADAEAVQPKVKIGEDNKGHRLLKKMGWAGEALGARGSGIVEPVRAEGLSGQDRTGIGSGASAPAEGDDLFAAYQKRMMSAYKKRPNPMNNARAKYY